jgi:hypothetical protein
LGDGVNNMRKCSNVSLLVYMQITSATRASQLIFATLKS